MVKDIYGLSLKDIIPPSIAPDPQVQAIIESLDPEQQSTVFDAKEALIYSRIDELPEDVIDRLAWQFHVDFYESVNENETLPIEIKRGLVKTSILVHRRKGTQWAVQELCDIVFGNTKVEPWYKYGGQPYHFNISIDATLPNQKAWEKFFLALEVTKSVRDWLDAIEIRRDAKTELRYGLGVLTSGTVTISYAANIESSSDICVFAGIVISGKFVIPASEEV